MIINIKFSNHKIVIFTLFITLIHCQYTHAATNQPPASNYNLYTALATLGASSGDISNINTRMVTMQKQAALTQVIAAQSNAALNATLTGATNAASWNSNINILMPNLSAAIANPTSGTISTVIGNIINLIAVNIDAGTTTSAYDAAAMTAAAKSLQTAVNNWITFYS